MTPDEIKQLVKETVREELRLTLPRLLDERGLNGQQLSEMDKLIHENPMIQYIMRSVEDTNVLAKNVAELFAGLELEKYKNKPKALVNFLRNTSKPMYNPLIIEEQLVNQLIRYVEDTANNGVACRIINNDAREILVNMQKLPKAYWPPVVGDQWMAVQIVLTNARLVRQPTVDEIIAAGLPFNRRDRVRSAYPHAFVLKRPAPIPQD